MRWAGVLAVLACLEHLSYCQSSSDGLGSIILQGLGSSESATLGNSTSTSQTLSSPRPFYSANTTQITPTATGDSHTTITTAPNIGNHSITVLTLPGLAVFGNTTFATSCPYSDLDCYQTCTSLGSLCMSSWAAWRQISQSCPKPSTVAVTTYGYTDSQAYSTYDNEQVVTFATTATTLPGYTTTMAQSAIDPSCTRTDRVTYTTTSEGYTLTLDKPYCEETLTTTTLTFPATTMAGTWTATYALSNGSAYSTYLTTFATTGYETVCDYSIPPPSCPSSLIPYHGDCMRGPDCNECTIHGGSVQLLYFPVTSTAIGNATTAFVNGTQASPTVTPAASLIDYYGTTLTSPSVYISFETVYAKNDCNSTIGRAHTGSILGLDLTDLSSALGNYHARITDTSALAEGKSAVSLYAEPFNLADLNWPYPPWAWQQQERCNEFIVNNLCPVIVSGEYNPVLAVPPQIRSMDPAWSSCALDLEGLYDPPQALQPADSVAKPTVPGEEASPSTPAAAAPTPASPTPAPTAIAVEGPTTPEAKPTSLTLAEPNDATPTAEPDAVSSPTGNQPSPEPTDDQPTPTQQPADPDTNPPLLTATNDAGSGDGQATTSPGAQDGDNTPATEVAPIATVGSGSIAVTFVQDPSNTGQVVAQSDGGATTLQAGGAGTINNQGVSIGSTGNVVLATSSTVDFGKDPASTGAAATVIGSNTIAQDPSGLGVQVNGQTLRPGQATVISGPEGAATVSAYADGVVAVASQGSTSLMQAGAGSVTGSPSGYVVAGQSASAGGPAAIEGGTTYSALASGSGLVAVADGSTSTVNAGEGSPVTLGGGAVVTAFSNSGSGSVATVNGQKISRVSNGAVIGGSTLTAGSPPKTIGGEVYSVNDDGQLVVAGSTTLGQDGSNPTQTASAGTSKVVFVAGGHTYTALESAGDDMAVVDGTTLHAGSSAVVVGGETISLGPSGLVIASDGHISTASFSSASSTGGSATRQSADGTSTSTPGPSVSSAAADPSSSTQTAGSAKLSFNWLLGYLAIMLGICFVHVL